MDSTHATVHDLENIRVGLRLSLTLSFVKKWFLNVPFIAEADSSAEKV